MSMKRLALIMLPVLALLIYPMCSIQAEHISMSMPYTIGGQSSYISVRLGNMQPLIGLEMPMKIYSDQADYIIIDSFTLGQRVINAQNSYFPFFNSEDSLHFSVMITFPNQLLPSGDGEIFRIHFHTIPTGSDIYLQVDTLSYWAYQQVLHRPVLLDADINPVEFSFNDYRDYIPSLYICGDMNYDRIVNQMDLQEYVNLIFGINSPKSHWPPGDVDCDYDEDFVDLVYLVRYLYRDGPIPCSQCK